MTHRELPIHVAILDYLRCVLPRAIVAHIPNGGARDSKSGAMMKRLGALAGMPDLMVLLPQGRSLWIEVKADRSHPSKSQTEIRSRLFDLGHHYVIVRSVDDARDVLRALQIETREAVTQ